MVKLFTSQPLPVLLDDYKHVCTAFLPGELTSPLSFLFFIVRKKRVKERSKAERSTEVLSDSPPLLFRKLDVGKKQAL